MAALDQVCRSSTRAGSALKSLSFPTARSRIRSEEESTGIRGLLPPNPRRPGQASTALSLPRPACGERVGVRGTLDRLGLAESPPHPALRADLSPQAGRGDRDLVEYSLRLRHPRRG